VKENQSDEGEFRAELARGKYSIEVSAPKYYPTSKQVSISTLQPVTLRAYLKPTTGSIVIGPVESDATILLDGQTPAQLNLKVTPRRDQNQIEMEDVAEGIHSLVIKHPSIADLRKDRLEVQGGATTMITPKYEPAIANLIIRSEPGADIFVDGRMAGRTNDSGELRISDKPGRHTVKAEKDKFESAQKTENFGIGEAVVEVKLTGIKSSPEFADYFQEGANYWEPPKSWEFKRGRVTVKDFGVGLLKDKVYDDFKMTFDISFINSKGAVWVVRARDKKNFYLFQLSGPKGANPKLFRSYLYQNGQLKLLKSDAVVEDLSRPNDSITITIDAKGPTIKHFIKLKSAPAAGAELLSTLTDSSLSYGTVGFGSLDNEEFVLFFVNIAPDGSRPSR
jgi:hypothetical protein